MAWAAGIGGALLAMILLGYIIARSRPKKVYEPPPPPPRPAHEIALEKLDAIAADALIENGETMAFYIRLSETIREYLGNRYGYHALEMTTTEITAWLRAIRLPPSVSHKFVSHLLYECDLVKFAKYVTSKGEQQEALDNGYLLVRETQVKNQPVSNSEQRRDHEEDRSIPGGKDGRRMELETEPTELHKAESMER